MFAQVNGGCEYHFSPVFVSVCFCVFQCVWLTLVFSLACK